MEGRLRRAAIGWGLSLASGILLALTFLVPPSPHRPLIGTVAIVPWIVLFASSRLRPSAWLVLPGAYLFAVLAGAGIVSRAPLIGGIVPVLFIPPLLAFSGLLRRLGGWSRLPSWAVVPFAWIGCEWIRCTYSPGSLEIYLLGHAFAGIPALIQVADLVGSYGVSWLAAAANTIVAWEILERIDPARAPGGRARVWRLVILGGPIVASLVYGVISLSSMEMRTGPRLFAIRLDGESRAPDDPREREKRYVEMTYRAIPKDGGADLIVWPKEAIPDVLLYDEEYLGDFEGLGNRFRCPILVGARGYSVRDRDARRVVAVHLTAAGQAARVYEQNRLLPGLDVAPFEVQLRRLRGPAPGPPEGKGFADRGIEASRGAVWGLLGTMPPLEAGIDLLTFDLPGGTSFGAPLGPEVTSHRWCREAKERGARFLVSLDRRGAGGRRFTDAVRMSATFRAVEGRLSILRVEDGGDCFLIDPAGRPASVSPYPGDRGSVVRAEMPILEDADAGTARGGEYLGRIAAVFTLALLLVCLAKAPSRVHADR